MTVLRTNCEETWASGVCTFGNLCGIASFTVWFVVLWPQILKNYRLRSVEGLSVLWATANFTASLVNCFFVFHDISAWTYFRLVSVYRTVLELVVLIQFWVYSKHNVLLKLYFACGCFLIWVGVVTLELSVARKSVDKVQWIAVVLWTLQVFPQIVLNIKLRSTDGQASATVHLGQITKSLYFLFVCLTDSQLQYVVMIYMSSSLTFINAMQLVWYSKPKPKRMIQVSYYGYGSNAATDEGLLEADECEDDPQFGSSLINSGEDDTPSIEEMSLMASWKNYQWDSYVNRIKSLTKFQMLKFLVWFLVLVLLLIGLCIRVNSPICLFGPVIIILVLLFSVLYRDFRENLLPCCKVKDDQTVSRIL